MRLVVGYGRIGGCRIVMEMEDGGGYEGCTRCGWVDVRGRGRVKVEEREGR